MSVKLTNKVTPTVHVGLMEDGDIAEIITCVNTIYIGNIVMRSGSNLIHLGQPIGKSWLNHFPTRNSSIQVRILQPGEQLTII